ncbi:hypothetical protein FF80_04038 [Devosia sp. LC5]|nr:hypothetical protein FF80_04038 [Devosia sp. LC5]
MAVFCASGAHVLMYAPLRFSKTTIFGSSQPEAHRSCGAINRRVVPAKMGISVCLNGMEVPARWEDTVVVRDALERFALRV